MGLPDARPFRGVKGEAAPEPSKGLVVLPPWRDDRVTADEVRAQRQSLAQVLRDVQLVSLQLEHGLYTQLQAGEARAAAVDLERGAAQVGNLLRNYPRKR